MILHLKLKETFLISFFFFSFVQFFTIIQQCFKRRWPATFKALKSSVLFATFHLGTRKSNQLKDLILVQKALDSQGEGGTSEYVDPKTDKVVKKKYCQCCEEFEGEDF